MKGQSRIVVYSLSHVQLFVTPRTAACQDSIFFNSSWSLLKLMPFWRILEETIALTRQTFVDKVMSLLFNMQSRFVIAFLPRRKCLLISWLQSPSVVIWEPKKIKSVTVSFVSPSICHEIMGSDDMIFISGGQNIGVSASTSVPPVNTQD